MKNSRLTNDEFDADFVYGLPRGEGLLYMLLGQGPVPPLYDPVRARKISEPADLFRQPLIQSDTKLVRWPHWFDMNGLTAPTTPSLRFD